MSGVRQGSRLQQLEALRARLDHEINVERRRTIIAEHRPATPAPPPPREPTPRDDLDGRPDVTGFALTTRTLLDDLDVTPRQVKEWAVSVGLIPAVTRGRVSLELVRSYARAKGYQ